RLRRRGRGQTGRRMSCASGIPTPTVACWHLLPQVEDCQLHDLQIDPDQVTQPRRHSANRLTAWRRAHRETVALGAAGIVALLETIGPSGAGSPPGRAEY